MKFYQKYRKPLAVVTLAAVAAGSIYVGGLTDKEPESVVADTDTSVSMNGTMMQYFEWDLPNDGSLWNTIASKANSIDITNLVIEVKTEIENIREQIQNIE